MTSHNCTRAVQGTRCAANDEPLSCNTLCAKRAWQALTECDESEAYESEAATATTDRACEPLSDPCEESGQMEAEAPSPTSDRVCVATTSTTATSTTTTTTTTSTTTTTTTTGGGDGASAGGTGAGGTGDEVEVDVHMGAKDGNDDDDDGGSKGPGRVVVFRIEAAKKIKKMTADDKATVVEDLRSAIEAQMGAGITASDMSVELVLTGSKTVRPHGASAEIAPSGQLAVCWPLCCPSLCARRRRLDRAEGGAQQPAGWGQ